MNSSAVKIFFNIILLSLAVSHCGKEEKEMRTPDNQLSGADQKPIFAEDCPKDTFNHNLVSDKIVNKGDGGIIGPYTVKLDSQANIVRNPGTIVLETNFQISSIDPEIARNRAEETVAKLNGLHSGILLETDWHDYFTATGASRVRCGVYPIAKLETIASDELTAVTFEPALPFLVNSMQTVEAWSAELGSGLNFEGIKATVEKVGGSGIKRGTTFDGHVKISATNRDIYDYAFRIETEFQDQETTMALGLIGDIVYFVKDGSLKKVVVTTGNDETPTITYHQP